MSSNKDFLPSSSPISYTCAIEIEAILVLFLFMMNCYKSSFQECITITVLKIERTRNQPPYCLLQLQEKKGHSAFPGRVVLGLPSPSPRVCTDGRTDGRTLTSEPKFFGSMGYQICLPMVLRELRYDNIFYGNYSNGSFQDVLTLFRSGFKRTSDVITYLPQTALNLPQNPVKYVKSCRSQTFSRRYTSNFALLPLRARLWPPSWNTQ